MDLAKYIGLFLLKNRFCYIHGLGNLEVKKKTVNYDGKTLQASPYEVVITPAGSIDDTLANFIATNEQISISKAANALRDFSTQSRADLQAGKEVVIPYLGKFVEENGKISFITEPNFQYAPPGIPSIRTIPQQQTPTATKQEPPATSNNPLPAPDYEKYAPKAKSNNTATGSLNWPRIIMAGVILLVIIGGITFALMMQNGNSNQNANIPIPVVKDDTKQMHAKPDTSMHVDSVTSAHANTPVATTVVNDSTQAYKMVVGIYTDKAKAEKRVNQFTNQLGKKAELAAKDSNTFYVIMPVKCKPADTTHVKDSLRRYYYPSGKVSIYP